MMEKGGSAVMGLRQPNRSGDGGSRRAKVGNWEIGRSEGLAKSVILGSRMVGRGRGVEGRRGKEKEKAKSKKKILR